MKRVSAAAGGGNGGEKSSKNALHNTRSLVDFIQEGIKKIAFVEKQVVLVVGTSGAGKSTLLNYIKGIPLKCTAFESKLKSTWKIVLNDKSDLIPRSFAMGHDLDSETLYPNVYTPEKSNVSFVDCPGFGDSRKGKVIPNLFFRKHVTEEAEELKIILVLSYDEIIPGVGKGESFLKSIKDLVNFCGALGDSVYVEGIKSSIGIMITQVPDNSATIYAAISDLTKNIEMYLEFITVMEGRPEKAQRIEELRGEVATAQTKMATLKQELDGMQASIEVEAQRALKKFITTKSDSAECQEADLGLALKTLYDLVDQGKFAVFSNPSAKVDLINGKDLIKIRKLIDQDVTFAPKELFGISTIVPAEHAPEVISSLIEEMSRVTNYMKDKLKEGISDFLKKELSTAEEEQKMEECRKWLDDIKRNGEGEMRLKNFVDSINENLLNPLVKGEIIEQTKIIEFLSRLLPKENLVNVGDIRKYLDGELGEYLNECQGFLGKVCEEERFEFADQSLVCKGHFIKVTDIKLKLEDLLINSANLKSIKIYAFNTVIFDTDLMSEKMKGKDVVIIAPKWHVASARVKIDLSGLDQKSFPDDKDRGSDGTELYRDGQDGKVGLLGVAGGNFFGFGQRFQKEENLIIISNGGTGGSGQKGGDAKDGRRGDDAKISAVTKANHVKKHDTHISGGYNEYCILEGEPGEFGGKKGRGGAGGSGGDVGKIDIRDLKFSSVLTINQKADQGCQGHAGSDGRNGIDGSYGATAIRIYYVSPFENSICSGWKSGYLLTSKERAKNGVEASHARRAAANENKEDLSQASAALESKQDDLELHPALRSNGLQEYLLEYKEYYAANKPSSLLGVEIFTEFEGAIGINLTGVDGGDV